MQSKKDIKREAEEILNKDGIRLRLMFTSLYLTAYEILKDAIIEPIKDFFVFDESNADMVSAYESELKISLKKRGETGLIPSCEWLKKMEVYDDADIDTIKQLRNRRNTIAHQIPDLILSTNLPVSVKEFEDLMRIVHKTDVFWSRSLPSLNLNTLEEVDLSEASDEDIGSGSASAISLIMQAVVEYAEQLKKMISTSS